MIQSVGPPGNQNAFRHVLAGIAQRRADGLLKRPLVGSLSANLQRFGMERVAKVESLQEIIADMTARWDRRENQPRISIIGVTWRGIRVNGGLV